MELFETTSSYHQHQSRIDRGSQESNALINGVKLLYFTYQPGNQDKERLYAFNVSVSQYDTLPQKEGDRHQML